jgi:hypothetical protein
MRNRVAKVLALATCLLLASSLQSRAATITATPVSIDPVDYGTVYLNGNLVGGQLGGAGVGNLTWAGDPANVTPFNGAFSTYCLDLNQDISLNNPFVYNTAPLATAPQPGAYIPPGGPMGPAKANQVDILYGKDYSLTLGVGAGDDRAAFQLAIWNIVYDNDASVTAGAGTFYAVIGAGSGSNVDQNTINLANQFLADAVTNAAANQSFAASDIIALIGEDGAQDQVAINNPNFIIVQGGTPLPNSAMGAGMLIAIFGGYRALRSRKLQPSA